MNIKSTPMSAHRTERSSFKMGKAALNFWFDSILLLLFVLTGVTAHIDNQLHKTCGLLMLAAIPLHLWLHWQWMMAVGSRVRQVKPNVRLKAGINLGMLLVFCLLICSGLIVMLIWAPAVSEFHKRMAYSFIALVAIHLGMHWKWIAGQIKRRLPTGNL